MTRLKMGVVVMALALGFTTSGWSQGTRGGRGQQAPQLFGEFKPVIGSGAQYQMTGKNGTMTFAYVIVGQENVEGNPGYWMEIRSEAPGMSGEMVMKQLVVTGGEKPQVKRMIMQSPGQQPIEMPMGMMGLGRGARGSGGGGGGETSPGVKVGTETITVPAGTFECDHYRKQQPKGTIDVWISTKVYPYGVVKMSSEEMTTELSKVLSNETSHIKGEPQKMNIPRPHF